MILKSINEIFEAVLTGAVTTDELEFFTSASRDGVLYNSYGTTNGTTPVTIASTGMAAKESEISYICIYNKDTVPAEVTIMFDDGSNVIRMFKKTLTAGTSLQYTKNSGWQ
jgi:hypothetical protein